MNKSEQINELAAALSKFQGEVRDADKDSQAYSYKYAKLDQLFEIIRPIMAKHGLSFIQPPQLNSGQDLEVETWILHSSGQYISSSLKMPINFEAKGANSLQKIGMAISYAKRYAIMGMLGICQKDEDDNGESDIKDRPQFKKREQTQEPPKLINSDQAMDLIDLINQVGKTEESICKYYQVDNILKLNLAQYSAAVQMLKKAITKKEATNNDNT